MRILFILEYYYPHVGGVETFFHSLIDRLDAQGHQITVLTNRYDNSLQAQEKIGSGTTIIRKKYFNRYGFTFLSGLAAIQYAREADLIHTTSFNAAIPAWIAAKITRTKSVITFHERWGKLWYKLPWMSYPSRILHYFFEYLITHLHFDRFVAVSDFTKDSLMAGGIKQTSLTRIYNGINYMDWPVHTGSKADDPFTFLFYGRVGHAKGLDVLLPAYAALLKNRKDHLLELVLPSEDTPMLRKVKEIISKTGISDHIRMYHDLEHSSLLKRITSCDSVVIPSYSEGFCFAAVETIAIGAPIISSGQGALKEVVSRKFIQLSELSPPALTDAMSDAIEDKWEYSDIRRFHLGITIDEYVKLYHELAGEDA